MSDHIVTCTQLQQARREKRHRRTLGHLQALALALALFAGALTWQNAQGRTQEAEVRMLSRRMDIVEQRTQYIQARLDHAEHPDPAPYNL